MREKATQQKILVSELGECAQRLVRDAGQGRLRLVVVDDNGDEIAQIRRVDRAGDIWANYDPEAARAAWRRSAGTLQGVDVEDLLTELRAAREQDSQGRSA